MKTKLRKIGLFFVLLFITSTTLVAQVIKGNVRDSRETIIGASIVEKGTLNGTVSDIDGNFSLQTQKPNAVLVVSYVGYDTQEIKTTGSGTYKILLKESSVQIDEVVVVGYGVQKRSSVTGSIASVSADKLDKLPVDNVSNMIGGRLPGLVSRQTSGVPGENGSEIFIRGISTTGNSSPLILVDGIERTFDNLDPSEIDQITVLKDAASAAIYGVKGANGVILVTTKRGKSSEKINVTYNGQFNISTNTNFPEFLHATDYALWQNKAVILDGQTPLYDQARLDYINNGNDPQGIFGNTNWFDLIFKPCAPATSHSLNISGGSERVKFYVAATYLNQTGIIDNVNFDRFNLRSNIDMKFNKYVDLKVDVAGHIENHRQPGVTPGSKDPTNSKDNGGADMGYKNIVFYAIAAKPTVNPMTPDGQYIGYMNPLIARDKSGFTYRNGRFVETTTTLSVKVPGVKGLKFTGLFSYDYNTTLYKKLLLPQAQVTPKFEEGMNGTPLTLLAGLSPHRDGPNELSEATNDFNRYTFQAIANYNNQFGAHDLGIDLVWEQSGAYARSNGSAKRNLPITTIPDLDFGTEVSPNSVYGRHSQSGRAGVVGRVNYTYDNKYIAQVSGRADWSAKFAKDKRLGLFPAVSLAWRISEENFLKDNCSFLNNLKLRGSWGILGNDAISDFIYLQGMQLSSTPSVVLNNLERPSLFTSSVPNRGITWETTTTYNGGFEATLWNGLLSMEADVFYKVTNNILQSQAGLMPPSIGGNYSTIVNGGTVDVRGFELMLSHRNTIGKDFKYNLSANVSFARNRFVSTDDSPNIPTYQRRIGQPLGSVLGYVSEGLYQTQEELLYHPKINESVRLGDIMYKDINGDGRITAEDRTWIAGSQTPEIMYGFNIDCSYKWVDLTLFFQGAANTDIMLSGTYSALGFSNGTFFTQAFKWGANAPYYLVENSWTPEHTNAEYPRLSNAPNETNFQVSDFWKRNASYLRLKNVQLGLNIPSRLTQKWKIQGVRVYLSGSNLLTFSNLKFIDPEAPSVNNGYYPQQRVYTVGLNVVF